MMSRVIYKHQESQIIELIIAKQLLSQTNTRRVHRYRELIHHTILIIVAAGLNQFSTAPLYNRIYYPFLL